MNSSEPRLRVCHVDDLTPHEVRAQLADGVRASVWNRFAAIAPMLVAHTRYDAGMMLARHAHKSDEVILVLEGEVRVGDDVWRPGTIAVLERGAFFGPLIAGPEGVVIFEVFNGPAERAAQDRTGYDDLLHARGVTELPNPPFELPGEPA